MQDQDRCLCHCRCSIEHIDGGFHLTLTRKNRLDIRSHLLNLELQISKYSSSFVTRLSQLSFRLGTELLPIYRELLELQADIGLAISAIALACIFIFVCWKPYSSTETIRMTI